MKARLEAGYWPFYPPPGYGFAKVPGHGKLIEPREPEASLIREALEGFASGRFPTQVDVQRFLRGRGFNHWGRGTGAYLEQVKRLLTREVYAGIIHYPPWNVPRRPGHHQPLISGETFDRIQERLREKQRLPPRKDLNADFPLRGFVVCGDCGKPLTASWSRGKRKAFPYYRCKTLGCPSRDKSIRADRMHAAFEELLKTLRPREAILQGVRTELQTQWRQRMLDVEAVRKERQRKLDAIQAEIDSYLEAVGRCHSPLVLQRIEEQVEELEARKLRLGGRIEASQDYDFDAALEHVFGFLKDPLLMWSTGDLAQRRLVLRLVFDAPLAYHRTSGFGTPTFSLPVAVSCVPELDLLEVVDMVRRSWNTLAEHVREWAAAIRSLTEATNARPPA